MLYSFFAGRYRIGRTGVPDSSMDKRAMWDRLS